jgi:hypothetical protein
MSHTVRVQIEFRNREALLAAVQRLNWRVLGEGSYKLFSSTENGLGIQIPGWKYPIIIKDNGTVAFDDYNGQWGNRADIEKLRAEYALEAARLAAEAQGWYYERLGEKLVIYHPDGGTITVDATGSVDASGFIGASCTRATEPIEAALGARREQIIKKEYLHENAKVQVKEESL